MIKRTLGLIRSFNFITTVHLPHKHIAPVISHHFTDRGLIVHPQPIQVPKELKCQVSFVPSPEAAPALPSAPQTYYPLQDIKPPRPKIRGVRRNLRTSYKKILGICNSLPGQHVYDAIALLDASKNKNSPLIKHLIERTMKHAIQVKGMHEERLFIKECFIGKNRGIKTLRIHARGRHGDGMRCRSQVTIYIEERTVEDVFQHIVKGKFPPGLAYNIRQVFLRNDVSYESIRENQNLLTSKGRQQQKLMFEREVAQRIEENKVKGLVLSKERVENEILKERAAAFVETYWKMKREEADKKLAERQELYIKNEGLK